MSLDPNNLNYKDEYEKISDLFKKTAANQKIVQIERIQNPSLFKQYFIKKRGLDEKNGSNEMLLFHGTKGDKLEEINETGLNRNFAGINGKVQIIFKIISLDSLLNDLLPLICSFFVFIYTWLNSIGTIWTSMKVFHWYLPGKITQNHTIAAVNIWKITLIGINAKFVHTTPD